MILVMEPAAFARLVADMAEANVWSASGEYFRLYPAEYRPFEEAPRLVVRLTRAQRRRLVSTLAQVGTQDALAQRYGAKVVH